MAEHDLRIGTLLQRDICGAYTSNQVSRVAGGDEARKLVC